MLFCWLQMVGNTEVVPQFAGMGSPQSTDRLLGSENKEALVGLSARKSPPSGASEPRKVFRISAGFSKRYPKHYFHLTPGCSANLPLQLGVERQNGLIADSFSTTRFRLTLFSRCGTRCPPIGEQSSS